MSSIAEIVSAVNKVGVANNSGKVVPKYILAMFEELTSQFTNARDEQSVKHAQELKLRDTQVSDLNDKLIQRDEVISKLQKDQTDRDVIISQRDKDITELQFHTDSLGQYNRRENIKITGVPYNANENLTEIVQSISNHIGVTVDNHSISTIHRLPPKHGSSDVPNIIMRVSRRSIKHELMDKKRILRTSPHEQYPNVALYEDVTPLRSRMLYALRNRKGENDQKQFKFTWTKEGRIFCRTEQEANAPRAPNVSPPKPRTVNRPEDMLKLGFTRQEIDNIIYNRRA